MMLLQTAVGVQVDNNSSFDRTRAQRRPLRAHLSTNGNASLLQICGAVRRFFAKIHTSFRITLLTTPSTTSLLAGRIVSYFLFAGSSLTPLPSL